MDLYFLIPAVIVNIFNTTDKLATLTEIQASKARAEIETQKVMAETKTSDLLM